MRFKKQFLEVLRNVVLTVNPPQYLPLFTDKQVSFKKYDCQQVGQPG